MDTATHHATQASTQAAGAATDTPRPTVACPGRPVAADRQRLVLRRGLDWGPRSH
ncbi:hypothetical protein [Mobilicoccus sp.]|uniref:hypothetical protein n=1 Tax=Mobilicoccus sp. TaxID=2034349 RepID=UPI002896337E|nr:hypothetical protein [Mobilicoccus sp.]